MQYWCDLLIVMGVLYAHVIGGIYHYPLQGQSRDVAISHQKHFNVFFELGLMP